MFNNIGEKIKTWAVVECWLAIIASIIIGIFLIAQGMPSSEEIAYGRVVETPANTFLIFCGIGVAIFGSFFAWLSSLLVYGFGELIETNAEIAFNTTNVPSQEKIKEPSKPITWTCSLCNKKHTDDTDVCGCVPYISP